MGVEEELLVVDADTLLPRPGVRISSSRGWRPA